MFRPRASGDLALDAALFVDGGSIGETRAANRRSS
jgi:hypothetical protein